jgi:hypothetical protein
MPKRPQQHTPWGRAATLREEITRRALDLERVLMASGIQQIDMTSATAEYTWIEQAAVRLLALELNEASQ